MYIEYTEIWKQIVVKILSIFENILLKISLLQKLFVLWINKLDNHPCTCKMNTHMSAFINAHRHIVPVFLCQGDCLFVSDVAFLTSSLYM